ncbi:MAG: MarR family transcriptional regulator [Lachnospiraceae bacterium]|nr:MarR family transcriptional regulator [Lachnospiraceae bacterium]
METEKPSEGSDPNHELLTLLEKSGHFLYHRRNGRCGQRRILTLLDRWEKEHGAEEGMSQQELQKRLGIQSGSISEILGKMENSGLIRKARQMSDHRKICIFMTDAGRERLERKKEENRRQETLLFQHLTPEEQAELQRIMEKLLTGWAEDFGLGTPQTQDRKEGNSSCGNT